MIRMCLYLSEDRKQKLQDIAKKEKDQMLLKFLNHIMELFVQFY